MFPLPCPTSCSPFLRHCVAIPRLGRITPNATENPILILVPCLQSGGSAFGDRAPKTLSPLHAASSQCCARVVAPRDCSRSGMRTDRLTDVSCRMGAR